MLKEPNAKSSGPTDFEEQRHSIDCSRRAVPTQGTLSSWIVVRQFTLLALATDREIERAVRENRLTTVKQMYFL